MEKITTKPIKVINENGEPLGNLFIQTFVDGELYILEKNKNDDKSNCSENYQIVAR